jgi:hypothetical protein
MSLSLAQLHPPTDASGWVAISVAILAVAYLWMRGKARQKRDPLERGGGARLSMAQHRQVERQMSDLLVELSEMARQISSQLDTRAAKLELLIKEADEKIATLQSGRPPQNPSYTASSAMRLMETIEPETTDASDAPLRITPETDARHTEIYSLADAGQSAHDIAKQLGRPRGEIELILALRTRA